MITILEQFRNLLFEISCISDLKKKPYYFLFISISILEILKRLMMTITMQISTHTEW